MDFEHRIIGFKDRGDKNYVDENVSEHGNCKAVSTTASSILNRQQFQHKKEEELP